MKCGSIPVICIAFQTDFGYSSEFPIKFSLSLARTRILCRYEKSTIESIDIIKSKSHLVCSVFDWCTLSLQSGSVNEQWTNKQPIECERAWMRACFREPYDSSSHTHTHRHTHNIHTNWLLNKAICDILSGENFITVKHWQIRKTLKSLEHTLANATIKSSAARENSSASERSFETDINIFIRFDRMLPNSGGFESMNSRELMFLNS